MSISRREFFISIGAASLAAPAMARIGDIEIGVCRGPKDLANAVEYGFDYLEPAAADIAEMDDAAFETFKKQVFASPIRCEAYNSFIRRKDLRVVGDEVNWDKLNSYLDLSLGRCRALGGSVVVWGSAGSRNVPPGYSRDKAWEQIADFLRRAGPIAKKHRIVIAIEPLRHQESNIINTGAEALRLVHEVHHPNIKMIIDYYHMRVEHESPEIVWTARKQIVHFHFANPNGRVWPRSASEDPEYGAFFKLVKKIRFRGGISIEARGTFEEDAKASLTFFRDELNAV